MFKIAHTSDWQMGMMASGLGAAAREVRAARLDAIKNVLSAANTHQVNAIFVAGDLFEDNEVDSGMIEQVADLLNSGTTLPIYIISGNHDPATLNSIYRRKIWSQLRTHVHPVIEARELELAPGVKLYPCPLATKNGMDDPTAWIPARNSNDDLRIGLAHGTMRIRPDVGDDDFPIPLDAPHLRELDYLALGHWHSALASPCGRAWYSGTPETTKFGERGSGDTLIVTLTGPGQVPTVQAVRTGTLSWTRREIDLDASGFDDLMRELRELPDARKCLLALILSGTITPENRGRINQLTDVLTQRFLYHTCDTTALRPAAGEAAMMDLAGSPYLVKTAEELAMLAAAQSNGSQSGDANLPANGSAVARRAIEILHEAAWSSRGES